jgi:ATP-binding cassette subfamily B protein RaxB
MKPILQTQSSESALACLAMVASAHGLMLDLDELRRRFPLSPSGSPLHQLIAQAGVLGFAARPARLDPDHLSNLQLPCVLQWGPHHFVVLQQVRGGRAVILDPAVGRRRLSISDIAPHVTGVALALTPGPAFHRDDRRARIGLRQLAGHAAGHKPLLVRLLLVTFVLELVVIAGPLLNQKVIDTVLTQTDRDLSTVLVVGCGLLLLAQAVVGAVRGGLVTVLGHAVQLQCADRLFARLLRLPLRYFEQRHLGDVVSRFGAVEEIRRTLTTSSIEALLDGLMAIAALAMMLAFAPSLAGVVVVAVLTYALVRWAGHGPLLAVASERVVLVAREHTHVLETLRAVAPLKLFGAEPSRRASRQKLLADIQHRDLRTERLNIGLGMARTMLFGVENLLVLWLGARLVMDSAGAGAPVFTIGMLFAFLGYKGQFAPRMATLIDRAVDLQMLCLHAARLADIASHEPEPDAAVQHDVSDVEPTIELRNVGFRYGDADRWTLRHVSARIESGDHVAITGPSGAGKTTLLKIMLGLLRPTEGEVLYGGLPLRQLGVSVARRLCGAVMQDDRLMSGSLADNIAFFDPEPDAAWIEACARRAQLHDDIVAMPMGYDTPLGDLGAGLSGGQRQRLLLARALYKRPRVLLLDDSMSQLDVANERAVSEALAHMRLTRIVIAHRPETIACARRVLRLRDGRLDEPAAAVVDDHPRAPQLQGA